MRFAPILSVAALAAFATAEEAPEAAESSTPEKPSDVLTLSTSSFGSSVEPEPLMLVEFYAPWCGHCKALAPHYEEAATTLKEKNIKLAKVDCVEEAELCQTHGVQGYPTLKVFRNGTPTEYSGPRVADGIVSYMTKQSLPAVSEVSSANFEEFHNADKIVAIAYVSSSTSAPAPEFSKVAEKLRDSHLFGVSTDAELMKKEGITPPAVVVYRAFDEPQTTYPAPAKSATEEDITEFIKELVVPTIDEVSGENYGIYAASMKPLAYVFINPTEEGKEELIAAVKPVAAEFKSKLNFVWIDAVKFSDHGRALNLPEAKYPSFVIQELTTQLKFPMDQTKHVNAQNVKDFVKSYLDKKIEPTLKSEPIPPVQVEDVYTVVGKEFDRVIMDDSKDVFVEFYATWCGHCKRLKPIWDQLGSRYAEIKDKITIAKFEATENDLPPSVSFRIAGFPTIKFKPAGSKEFIDYEGDRSLEDMVAFVQKNAKNDVTVSAPPPTAEETTPIAEAEAPHAEAHDEL